MFSDKGHIMPIFSFQHNTKTASACPAFPPINRLLHTVPRYSLRSMPPAVSRSSPLRLLLLLMLMLRRGWNEGWKTSSWTIEEGPRTPTRALRTLRGRR